MLVDEEFFCPESMIGMLKMNLAFMSNGDI